MLGPLPAWVCIPWPYMLFKFGFASVTVVVVTLVVATILTQKGRTLMWTIRRARSALRANRTDARPIGYRRAMNMDVAMHDFDFDQWRNS